MTVDPTFETDEAAALSLLAPQDAPQPEDTSPDQPEAYEAEEGTADDAQAEDQGASEDETEQSEVPEDQKLYTVKVDGEEIQVTLEELARSYSGEASIKRRIHEAEAQRKQAKDLEAALASEYQRVQQAAQQLLATGLKPAPTPPDPRLLDQNPLAYLKAKAAYEQDALAYQRQMADLQAMGERQAMLARHAQEQHLAEQAKRLAEEMPEIADPVKGPALRAKLHKAAEFFGFTPEEVAGITDRRAVKMLNYAARMIELETGKAEGKRPSPAQAPRHVPPAAARRPEPAHLTQARQLKQAVSKGPLRDADAAALLLIPQPRS